MILRRTAVLLVAVLALAGCGGGDGDDGDGDAGTGSSSSPAPDDGSGEDGDPGDEDDDAAPMFSDTEVCSEVRAGIDAFNEGDLEETVSRFEAAVPLAEDLAEDDPTAEDLLDAVRYYATLPAEEYQEASPSPEFQENKAITLTQCDYGSGPAEEPEGIPA